MTTRNKNRSAVNRRARQNKDSGPARSQQMGPPQFKSNVELSHKYRFMSTNGAATVVTGTSLLCAAGGVVTVLNTTFKSFFASVKVKRVTLWAPPASQGAAVTTSIEWIGQANSPNREISDTTVSVSRNAYVTSAPPPQSLASFWQNSASGGLFTLTAPANTVIDVDVQLILNDDDVAAATSAVAAGALGGYYYLSLDPNATHYYTPVSLVTTS